MILWRLENYQFSVLLRKLGIDLFFNPQAIHKSCPKKIKALESIHLFIQYTY